MSSAVELLPSARNTSGDGRSITNPPSASASSAPARAQPSFATWAELQRALAGPIAKLVVQLPSPMQHTSAAGHSHELELEAKKHGLGLGRGTQEDGDESLSSMSRALAAMGPGLAAISQSNLSGSASPAASLSTTQFEALLSTLVRKIGWSADRNTVRLEVGAGAIRGGVLTIHAGSSGVVVHVETPVGVDIGRLKERIAGRLAMKGVAIESIDVV